MSMWTYIRGTIEVEPMGQTQPQKRYILETVLDHLPRVAGSEGDMNVYIVQPEGFNSSCSCDEFGDRTNNLTDWNGDKVSKHGMLRTQDRYILVVDGSLRDRWFDETTRDFMNWMVRLSKRMYVVDVLISIRDYDHSTLWDNSEYFQKMYEWPSWCNISDNPEDSNWCEFMMWDQMKDSQYPMMLGYKYVNDDANDEEVRRRLKYAKGED